MTNRAATIMVMVVVGCYYLWAVRAGGPGFEWGRDLGGFYDYLGRALAHGRLYLPIEPAPELLALPNPWDPAVGEAYKVYDLALYKRRYYLYHGAGPAVVLFTPWRLLTRHDLPENFAVFLFSFGGFLFSCAALLRLLEMAGVRLGAVFTAALLLALGLCQGVPYLLNRIFVYEVAIAGGYFCIAGALYFLTLAIASGNQYQFAASGLMFGLAVACRPNLVFAAIVGLAASAVHLGRSRRIRQIIPFLASLCVVGLAIAGYNYARFDNPLEFGLNYLLGGGNNQNRVELAARFLPPGLYFFLASAPDFSPVFPWVRLVSRYPYGSPNFSFPPGYFIEPMAGVLCIAPFIAAAFWMPSRNALKSTVRMLLWTALACSLAVLLSIAWTGFSTQRYEVDFLPELALVALANFAFHIHRSRGLKRHALGATLAVLLTYSAIVNLALGIAGPYDGILKAHPQTYLRLVNWFSPITRFRPLLNPYVSVAFTAEATSQPDDFRDPLVTLGSRSYRHFVYLEHRDTGLRIVSRSPDSTLMHDLLGSRNRPMDINVTYSPDSRDLTTMLDGQTILVHHLTALLTAPAEVTIGENRIDSARTAGRFTGWIRTREKTVRPN